MALIICWACPCGSGYALILHEALTAARLKPIARPVSATIPHAFFQCAANLQLIIKTKGLPNNWEAF
ncbi:hypothetical protein BEL04_13070 [Mucilaginibacter sp. PPCGB 2223]|nr:hypothetical protein BEL04_13070 [Mucilaginibacter sp. PPCGB 2223]